MRKLITVAAALVLSASSAFAIPIVPENYDTLALGAFVTSTTDPFNTASPPPIFMGTLDSSVYFDGALYTYVLQVKPTGDDNSHLNTAFVPKEFSGSMGWSFTDAVNAGGGGDALDFLTGEINGRLHWLGLNQGIGSNWDTGDSITFFFRSTAPPRLGDYNLLNGEAGTAQGLAPVPEPGTLGLMGVGLYGLYQARKRKKLALS
jgi:hypothetical protein